MKRLTAARYRGSDLDRWSAVFSAARSKECLMVVYLGRHASHFCRKQMQTKMLETQVHSSDFLVDWNASMPDQWKAET